MNIFEGYVGIRLWDGQLVDDVIFSLLLFLFIVFSFVFRTNFQLFVKMLKDAFLVKERQNLFDDVIGKSIFFFRNFMTFQVLFLSSIALIAVGRIYGFVNYAEWQAVLSAIGTVFCVLFLFYQFQSTYLYKVRHSYPNTFVPGRNMVFLTFAAILARSKGIFNLVTGVSEADFSGYPDCRDTFVRSLNVTLNLAMDEQFVIHTPLMDRDKSEVWELADELGVFDLVRTQTLTCYNGIMAEGCGHCPACKLRREGLEKYLKRRR